MIHLVSALIVGSVYGGGYSIKGKDMNVYRVSIGLLFVLVAIVAAAFLFETQIVDFFGASNWGMITYARNAAVYSLWLQSLICTALSVAALMNHRHWKYLAFSIGFCTMFLVLGYATSNPTSLALLG